MRGIYLSLVRQFGEYRVANLTDRLPRCSSIYFRDETESAEVRPFAMGDIESFNMAVWCSHACFAATTRGCFEFDKSTDSESTVEVTACR